MSYQKWLCKKNSHCTAYTTIFLLTIVPCYRNTYNPNKHTKSQYEEEPKEPLGIMTEIAAIIFLVAFTDFFPFISKHGIDLTDMRLHLCGHPLAFFGNRMTRGLVHGINSQALQLTVSKNEFCGLDNK